MGQRGGNYGPLGPSSQNIYLARLRHLRYREAVGSQSPGLPPRLPWVTELIGRFNRNAVASNWRNPLRVDKDLNAYPGLKQPRPLTHNRFAVLLPFILSMRVALQT